MIATYLFVIWACNLRTVCHRRIIFSNKVPGVYVANASGRSLNLVERNV